MHKLRYSSGKKHAKKSVVCVAVGCIVRNSSEEKNNRCERKQLERKMESILRLEITFANTRENGYTSSSYPDPPVPVSVPANTRLTRKDRWVWGRECVTLELT